MHNFLANAEDVSFYFTVTLVSVPHESKENDSCPGARHVMMQERLLTVQAFTRCEASSSDKFLCSLQFFTHSTTKDTNATPMMPFSMAFVKRLAFTSVVDSMGICFRLLFWTAVQLQQLSHLS